MVPSRIGSELALALGSNLACFGGKGDSINLIDQLSVTPISYPVFLDLEFQASWLEEGSGLGPCSVLMPSPCKVSLTSWSDHRLVGGPSNNMSPYFQLEETTILDDSPGTTRLQTQDFKTPEDHPNSRGTKQSENCGIWCSDMAFSMSS